MYSFRLHAGDGPLVREIPDSVAIAIESAHVPSLPQALLRLLEMVEDDSVTMAELATLVEQDPGLCARVLTAANSPALRRGTELRNVESCLFALGTRLVRSIATCLSVQSMFERQNGSPRTDLTDFWRHSLSVAELARALASASGYERPDEAYLAGLLHDVGELLLLSAIGDDYARVLVESGDECRLQKLESSSFGVNHGEIGTWLVDQWHFDMSFADGILFHHATADEIVTAGRLPQVVWLAHSLALGNESIEALVEISGRMFGPGLGNHLVALREQSEKRMHLIAEAIGIPVTTTADGAEPDSTLPHVQGPAGGIAATRAEEDLDAIVRDIALMQPLQRDLFSLESDAELLLSLRESARILFDLSRMAFLFFNREDGHLSGAMVGGQPAVFRQADIRVVSDNSLAAAAVAYRELRSSFDSPPPNASLLDVQFARAFASEGLLCVPMIARRRTIGVMVFGLGAAQHGRLKRRLPWLLNFGRIAAVSLEAWQDAFAYRQKAEHDASARFERQAKRVVHEAGNPLGIIKSYLKILDGKLPEGVEVRQELDVLREEIDRVAAIVHRMSEIPRQSPMRDGLDVADLVRELLALYGVALFKSRGIEVTTSFSETNEPVGCDPDSVKQMLLNLWKNASEAMTHGGRFAIGVADGIVQNGRRFVEVRMDDNGPGMPPEAVQSLSRPDEARPGGSRGMGLSIVGALAAQMRCHVTCRSKPGVGTTISILLPCRELR